MWTLTVIISSAVALFFSIRALRRGQRLTLLIRSIRTASKLHRASERGEFVKASGTLTYPRSETPYGRHNAGYWRTRVLASFQSKAPKPATGMQTHTPVLHRASLDQEPLLLSVEEGEPIHLVFADTTGFRGLERASIYRHDLPPELAHLNKTKYQTFEIVEQWYPPKETLFVIGKLADRNHACVTLTDQHARAFVSSGDESEVLMDFRKI